MKRFLIFFLCFIILFAPTADAAIGSKGLIIRDGKQFITLHKGEKTWLYIRDGFTKLPTFKKLCYYSDNTIVATVGLHSGVLHANSIGTATITVSNNKGDCGVLRVHVTRMKKGKPLLLLLVLPCLLLLFLKFK